MSGFTLDLDVNPIAYQRVGPRHYLSAETRAFRSEFRTLLLTQRPRPTPPGMEGPLALELRFWRRHRNTTGLTGDIDNFEKAVLDAGNGLLWCDDSQVRTTVKTVEAVGPGVDGRIWMHFRPDVRSAATEERLAETCAHLLESCFTPDTIPVYATAALDQLATAQREHFLAHGFDLSDLHTRRVVARLFDLIWDEQTCHPFNVGVRALHQLAAFVTANRPAIEAALQ